MVAGLQHGEYDSAEILFFTGADFRLRPVRCLASARTKTSLETSSEVWEGEKVDSPSA